ncbi:MAG: hypothetical protein JW837_13420 [Sedimentisphaerales bacterium]|nr:hypothetical protein [Sedimentisphaerales bacterium]
MKDKDVDKYLIEHLSGSAPREGFKEETLRDSTAALVRIQRRRPARRRAECAAAAVLIAGVAFLCGRLSAPRNLPRSVYAVPRATAGTDGIKVPSDLVAWLDAARLFKRLGMEERTARAFENAGKLLPYDAVTAINITGQTFSIDSVVEDVLGNRDKNSILTEISGPHRSVESISGIIAQSFGDHYYENKTD